METGSQQQLDRYSSPQNIAIGNVDASTPYSYKEWYNSHIGLIPGQEYRQYNEYLVKWYETAASKPNETSKQIRLNYLGLLKQLQLFIPQQELEDWYNQVNVEDEKELLLAIPYYARKLRDIALYYSQLRDKLKKTKLQYNLVGSSAGLTQQVITNLLDTYTQKPNSTITVPASVWNSIPQLSAIKDSINIQIEDYYDFQTYLGESPTVSVSSYFNLDDQATADYFTNKGLILSSNDWIYQVGNLNLSADSIYYDVLGPNIGLLQSYLTQKYLGENKYTSSTYSLSTNTDYYTLSVAAGNNFLYWPYGSYITNASNRQYYNPIAIASSGLTAVATAGETLQQADTIFIKTVLGTEGAWFRHKKQNINDNAIMYANFNAKSKTAFRYPFPGYGLSAEDIEWTGYSLSSTPSFDYLQPDYKTAIQQTYWATDTSLSSVSYLKINDTELVNNLAYPNTQYLNADKIRIWNTPPKYTDSHYAGNTKETWLYKFTQTDIPIAGFNNPSVIVWPYQRLDTTVDYPNYLPSKITTVCTPKSLTSINLLGATASDNINTADIVYKISNYKHGASQATEGAWLSGRTFYVGNLSTTTLSASAVNQPGLNCYFQSGTQTKFIWTGPDNTSISEVFKTINHETDCTFANTASATYLDSKLCSCRSVLFSPFGHPENNFTDNRLADFIALDDQVPEIFDVTKCTSFAWYKTNNKIGWGDGSWTSTNNSNLYLRTNQTYIYNRVNVQDVDSTTYALPNLTVRYPYIGSTNTIWIKAIRQYDGTWKSTDTVSNMVIRAGDFLRFERPGYTSYTLYSNYSTSSTIASSVKSVWTNYDYVGTDQDVIAFYPYKTPTNVSVLPASAQYPAVPLENILQYVQWSLTGPNTSKIYNNVPSFTFSPTITGTYYISLTALTGFNVFGPLSATTVTTTVAGVTSYNTYYNSASSIGYAIFNNIPAVTAVQPFTVTTLLTTFITPTPGYVINTPLGGWNYNTNKFDSSSNLGAQPFWSTAYNEKTSSTDYKGFISWGTPQKFFDEHNVILQPDISTIVLSGGEYLEYERANLQPLNWIQPLTFNSTVDEKTWCTLQFNTTALASLSSTLNNINTGLVTTPLTSPSTLLLQNYVNNEPVEVYYNAVTPFVWNITAVPQLSTATYNTPAINLSLQPDSPWSHLSNRFYPTFATLPFLGSLKSVSQIGGFFSPAYLGTSYYLNRDYTVGTVISSTQLTATFEDPLIHLGGRGLTQQDQRTPYYSIEENNAWLKEPVTSGPAAGNIKKNIAKTYQKFIPYQSSYETNSKVNVGLVTPVSRHSPWGGVNDAEWTDYANKTVNFAGEVNVDAWAETQILKNSNLQLDNWATDIFGTQYGLYKALSNTTTVDRKNVRGNIWTRKNSQFVSPAYKSLSGIFDSYKGTWLYNELVSGVVKIDVFFDTLYVETTGAVFLEKIEYNYNTDNIYSLADNARRISLAYPATPSLVREYSTLTTSNPSLCFNATYPIFAKVGETWFFPQEKEIILSICGLSSKNITPELYKLNLNTQVFSKIFPTLIDDINTIQTLSSLSLTSIDAPVLSHDSLSKDYVMTIFSRDIRNIPNIIEFKIKDLPTPILSDVTVYYGLTS